MSYSSTGSEFNVVLIVPTGIGAEIGGHAGDATPVARLLASVCDLLILHPNVVNASDINEMPENSWYVEGSTLDRFLEGQLRLRPVSANRVLVAVNAPVKPETVNAVSAARTTLGLDAEIVELETPLKMIARLGTVASGEVHGWEALVAQVKSRRFDALAIATPIDVERSVEQHYLRSGGLNPWGGVEAICSRLISEALDKPVAHAPVDDQRLPVWDKVVDPRMGAECVSTCYLYCVLKGLHRAPRLDPHSGFSVAEVACLVSPFGCIGRPHRACLQAGIPVIAVRENATYCHDVIPPEVIVVENYLEAAGLLAAMKSGIMPAAVRRPITATKIS
jgi:hypothetical protein